MPNTKQFNVRLPENSHRQLAAISKQRGETGTQVVIAALSLLYERSHTDLHYQVEIGELAACPWCKWDGRPTIVPL